MPELDPLVGDMSLTQTRWSAARPKPGLQISLNKLVKLLHGVLRHRRPYDEQIAWQHWLPNNHLTAAA